MNDLICKIECQIKDNSHLHLVKNEENLQEKFNEDQNFEVDCCLENKQSLPEVANDNQSKNCGKITNNESASSTKINDKLSQKSQENQLSFVVEIVDYKSEWDQLTDSEKMLGLQAPVWLPDPETNNCLKCGLKFTFRKRRHHCRACGLIFCSSCCYEKLELPYKLNNNEPAKELTKVELSRVCLVCFRTINKVNELKEKINQIENSVPIVSVLKKSKSTDMDLTGN